jgi:MHS family proline/betaine transporter-like MFS transporter
MAGAGIEYYDIALYGYMAPILVPIFLPDIPKTYAYFFFFLFEFFAAISQVVGASIFGKIGDTHGRKKAMYVAMLGTAFSTFTICLLPTYQSLGIVATILFASVRCAQSFFLGGEYNGGIIYCLEHEKDLPKHNIMSGLYCSLTVFGIIAASFVALSVNLLGAEFFRVAYGISFLLAIITYRYRKSIRETPEFLEFKASNLKIESSKILFSSEFTSIVVVATFFGILYGIPTRIFNSILPLAINIDTNQIMLLNAIFLVFYMFMLYYFGHVASRIGTKKVISSAIFATIFLTYPLMLLVESEIFVALILAKAVFATLAAAFMGPFHAWTQSLFVINKRYKSISTAYAVGKCFSTLILAFSILIFDHFQNLTSLGVILILAAIIAWLKFNNKVLQPIHYSYSSENNH